MNTLNWTEIQSLTSLEEIADAAHANAKEKGFHEDGLTNAQFLERHCMLIVGEVAELHESLRNNEADKPCDKSAKMDKLGLPVLTCAEEELADVIIRAFDISRRLGIDIHRAILAKHAYNTTRPHMHGKKF